MGECMFYLRATFQGGREANDGEKLIREIVKQGQEASDCFDDMRDDLEADDPRLVAGTGAAFVKACQQKWPLIAEMLGDISLAQFDIAEALSFPLDDYSVWNVGGRVALSGECWHLGDWTRLCRFIKKKCDGVIAVGWITEERLAEVIDPYDFVEDVEDCPAVKPQREGMMRGLVDAVEAAIVAQAKQGE